MTRFARWLRGALGVGLTWAALWMLFAILLWTVFMVFAPGQMHAGEGLARGLRIFGLVGLLSGLGFAALLSLAEHRRPLGELSLGRVALWGFLGSAAIPMVMGVDAREGWLPGLLGAIFATASVAIARRGVAGVQVEREVEPSASGPHASKG